MQKDVHSKRTRGLFLLILLLLPPALLINLDLMTFIEDESIRALVALEMMLSGDYITPTLNGELYYNKPPLYNWILILFYRLGGEVSEWMSRLPTVLSLLGFAATIYYFGRRHYGRYAALLQALALITCGRMLFWDSMLGLIDTFFSWLMFLLFMGVYHLYGKRKNYPLFLVVYFLASAGFLLKGLPALVFLGITLLVQFIRLRAFRKLISLPHLAGFGLFVLLCGAYYAAYAEQNSLDQVFVTLLSESTKRTVVEYGWTEVVRQILSFPLEMSYHFLPWTLLLIYFFWKKSWAWLRGHDFSRYALLVFFFNILLYWTSPEVYPRYLLMLFPLLFMVLIGLHELHRRDQTLPRRILVTLLGAVCVLVTFSPLAVLGFEITGAVSGRWWKIVLPTVGMAALTVLYFRWPRHRLLIVAAFLLVFRIGFNWLLLPARNLDSGEWKLRAEALRIGRTYTDRPIYVYRNSTMFYHPSFFISRETGRILAHRRGELPADAWYIVHPKDYPLYFLELEKVDSFSVRDRRVDYLYLTRLRE